eukprot:1148080-Pelagomonas_calceolata.AAC.5
MLGLSKYLHASTLGHQIPQYLLEIHSLTEVEPRTRRAWCTAGCQTWKSGAHSSPCRGLGLPIRKAKGREIPSFLARKGKGCEQPREGCEQTLLQGAKACGFNAGVFNSLQNGGKHRQEAEALARDPVLSFAQLDWKGEEREGKERMHTF